MTIVIDNCLPLSWVEYLRHHGHIARHWREIGPPGALDAEIMGCLPLRLDSIARQWEISAMETLTVDAHKRIRIPDARPQQVFAYENTGDGRRILTEIKTEAAESKTEAAEPFPPGSLRKYVTPERDAEMLELLKGCSLELPE